MAGGDGQGGGLASGRGQGEVWWARVRIDAGGGGEHQEGESDQAPDRLACQTPSMVAIKWPGAWIRPSRSGT